MELLRENKSQYMLRFKACNESQQRLLTQQRGQETPRHGRHHLLARCDIRYDAASIAIARARNPRDARHAGFVSVYPVVVLAI